MSQRRGIYRKGVFIEKRVMGREERLTPPRTGVPREEAKTTPQKPIGDVKLRKRLGRGAQNAEQHRLPAGPQGAELPLLGSVPTEKAGAEGAGGPRRGPLTLPVPPPHSRPFRGAGGVPALGLHAPGRGRGVGEAFQALAPSCAASCSRACLLPRPAPAPGRFPSGARSPPAPSSLISKTTLRFRVCQGLGLGEVSVSTGERVRLGRWKVLGDEAGDGWHRGRGAMGEGAEMG